MQRHPAVYWAHVVQKRTTHRHKLGSNFLWDKDEEPTCTTFVRSKQSIQLTRNTPFCSDMTMLFDIQRKLGKTTNLFSQPSSFKFKSMDRTYPWLSKVRCIASINFDMFSYLSEKLATRYPSSERITYFMPLVSLWKSYSVYLLHHQHHPKEMRRRETHETFLSANSAIYSR
jgi:hypothetical protein